MQNEKAFLEVRSELEDATMKFPPLCSAHEGYAIILEELDELKEEVFTNQKRRTVSKMMEEARHVAAMAIRFMVDIC